MVSVPQFPKCPRVSTAVIKDHKKVVRGRVYFIL